MVCVTPWNLYFEKSARPDRVWMETRDFLIAAPPASFCRCRKLFSENRPALFAVTKNLLALFPYRTRFPLPFPLLPDLLFSPRLFFIFRPGREKFSKDLDNPCFQTSFLFIVSSCFVDFFILFLTKDDVIRGIPLDWLDIDTEILISFWDSSLFLVFCIYIIVV